MTFKTIVTAAAAAASVGLTSAPVHAQDLSVRHEKVRFDDLDITRVAGARVMLERIHAASTRVCGPDESPRDLAMWADHRRCMSQSLKDAVADLGNPIVTAMYQGRATPRAYELAMTSPPTSPTTPPVR